MRPIEKTSEDLFQKLRSRFSPVSMGDESADETSTPSEARIFNFMYKDDEHDIGYVSISIIDNRSFKVYYGTDLVDRIENKTDWYNFLKDLRMFAKRNLMSFDARDLAKNQLEPRDFKFISQQDGTYKGHEVTVSESVMFGSRRKSYQTMENVKMIVNHRKSIDETIPGARSRYIESIYLERADGERYKFPYNYLTGARAMARHVNEGGNPYDDMGKHIIGMIKEMRDLSKFARRTKKHAMEDENAGSIRNSVVERFHTMKKQLGAMSVKEGYARFAENFTADEALVEDDAVQQIKERFTQQVFDTQLEDTLPAVMKAIKEAEMKQVAEADKSIAHLVKSKPLVLRKDDAADQMFRSTKFTDGAGLLGFILSDIASRAIGDGADEIANFASDAAERLQDKDYDQNDKQTAMMLAKKYMDDVKKMASNPGYADEVRVDPKNVYGKMKKREGGFHESEAYEAWANDLVPEDYDSNAAYKGKMDADNSRMWRNVATSNQKMSNARRSELNNRARKHHADSEKNFKKAVTGMDSDDLPESSKKKFELSKGEKHAYDQGRSRSLMKDQGEDSPYDDDKLNAAYAKGKEHYKVKEATTQGTQGTQAPVNQAQAIRDPNLQKGAKNVSKVAQAAGIKAPANQVAQGMAAQAAGKPAPRNTAMTTMGLGNVLQTAIANDPSGRKANMAKNLMTQMLKQGKFDEATARKYLEKVLKEAPPTQTVNRAGKGNMEMPQTTNTVGKGDKLNAYNTGAGAMKNPTQRPYNANTSIPGGTVTGGQGIVPQNNVKLTPPTQTVNRAAKTNLPPMPTQTVNRAAKTDLQKPTAAPAPTSNYTVNKGDNLSTLAKNWGVSVADIMKSNQGIKDPNKIGIGQKLVRPGATGNPVYQHGIGTKAGPQSTQNMFKK